MTRIQAAPKEHFGWLSARCGYPIGPDFRAIEAMDSSGRVRAMVGYDGWTPNSVRMHMAAHSPAWCRHILVAAFHYPFVQEDKGVALGFIPETNVKSLRMARHVGFSDSARIKDGWEPGKDLIVLEMRKENCRWIAGQRKAV